MDAAVPQSEAAAAPPAPPPGAQGASATIAKNSLWLLIDNVAGMITSFTCSILVARALGPDRMGEYNYVLWFAATLKMVSDVAIPATFRKFAAEFMGRGDYGTVKTMVRSVLRLQLKLTVVGAAIGLAIVFLFFRPEQRTLATLAVLTIVPALLLSVPAGVLYGTENLRYNVMGSVSAMAVNLCGVTMSVIAGWGLVGVVASLLVSRVADCTLRFLMFRIKSREMPGTAQDQLEPVLRKRLVHFAALQLVNSLLYTLLFDRMEVFFLKGLAPTREIAFFSISFTLVQYLLIVPQTLAGSASVTIMVKQGQDPREAARIAGSATWFTILFGAPVLFGIAAVGGPLLSLLYGAKYLPAIPVLTVLAFFAVSLASSQSAQHLLVAAERQVVYILVLLLGAAVDMAGCFLLIPKFGAVGAAYAKGVSQAIAAAGFLLFMVTRFHVRLPVDRIFKLVACCTAMYVAVHLVVMRVPPILGLLVGIPLGVAVFVPLMRWLRCLDKVDRDRLRGIASMLPGPARQPYRGLVDLLVPARRVEAEVQT